MRNYYNSELDCLKDSEFLKVIKISDNVGNATNTISLNTESMPLIIQWLESELLKLQTKGAQK